MLSLTCSRYPCRKNFVNVWCSMRWNFCVCKIQRWPIAAPVGRGCVVCINSVEYKIIEAIWSLVSDRVAA